MARKSLSAWGVRLIRLAAALMYCDDRSQEEIKTVLNLSQSAVSRLLKASEKGVFGASVLSECLEGIQRVPADVISKAEAIASGIKLVPRDAVGAWRGKSSKPSAYGQSLLL